MPLTLQPAFDTFVYDTENCDIETFQDGFDTRGLTAPVPRSNVAASRDGLLSPRQILVRGTIGATAWTTRDSLRTAEDAFKWAHRPGVRPFYRDSDRYVNAEVRSLTMGEDNGLLFIPFSLRLETADPYYYSTSEDTDTWSSPGTGDTRSVSNGGSATVAPKFTLTFGSTATLALTLTDTSLSSVDNYFTLAASITSGDVLEIDCLNQTVIYTPAVGDPSYKMEYFDGTFFELDPGSNTLELIFTGPTISSVVTEFRKRWL